MASRSFPYSCCDSPPFFFILFLHIVYAERTWMIGFIPGDFHHIYLFQKKINALSIWFWYGNIPSHRLSSFCCLYGDQYDEVGGGYHRGKIKIKTKNNNAETHTRQVNNQWNVWVCRDGTTWNRTRPFHVSFSSCSYAPKERASIFLFEMDNVCSRSLSSGFL